jgi:hypothetical protein
LRMTGDKARLIVGVVRDQNPIAKDRWAAPRVCLFSQNGPRQYFGVNLEPI